MAALGWTLAGPVAAVSDTQNADVIREPSSKQYKAISDIFAPLFASALAADPELQAALLSGSAAAVAAVVAGYFQPGTQTGLVTFPNGSEPGTVTGTRYAIDPAAINAGTASFHGLPLTTGTGTVSVRLPNGTGGTWGNSLTPGFQRATAGSAIVMALTDVGTGEGVSRVRIGGLAPAGTQSAMGGIVAAQFNTNDVKFFRWVIGTGGNYGLSRWLGTSLSSGSFSALSSTNVIARVDDLVDLQLDRANRLLILKVNGSVISVVELSAAVVAGHATASFAGMWMNGTANAAAKLGGWQWIATYSSGTGTVNRQIPSVGADLVLPTSLQLSPSQKRQVLGPVFNIKDYDAKCDGIVLNDVNTFAGQDLVQSPSYTFTTADIGKRCYVVGAGPVVANANDGVWIGTIRAISGSSAQLDTLATTTTTGRRCGFGTLDDVAYIKAQNAAAAAGGGTVFIPAGRSFVSLPLPVKNYVSWAGVDRELSWVHVVQDSNGSPIVAGECDWLTCAGRDTNTPLIGAKFHDFGIEAEAHIHSAGYGAGIKPLNIYLVQRCSIERMNVWNTPATAVPFDHSYDQCVIRDNVILYPGRLAPSGIGPGGSGIGAGTKGIGSTEPTLIENNVVIGRQSATTVTAGHNGIFTEGQTGADPDLGVPGYRIVNNVIIGCYYGISDTGSTGTVISGNHVIRCSRGIRLSVTTLPYSYPGLSTIVANNLIRECTGPGATDGVGITIYTAELSAFPSVREYLHTIIQGNQIIDNKSWGISISGSFVNIAGVMLRGNQILRNGRSGLRLASGNGSKLKQISAKDNIIASNGRAAVAGDQAGILVAPGTVLEGGYLQSRIGIFDITPAPLAPTQLDAVITTGATLTNVEKDPAAVLW